MVRFVFLCLVSAVMFCVCGTVNFVSGADLPAFLGVLNGERVETAECATLPKGKGVRLKDGVEAVGKTFGMEPDLVLRAEVPEDGIYRFWGRGAADAPTQERLKVSHSKMDSIPIRLAVNDGLVSTRYLIEPWRDLGNCQTRLGLFRLKKGETLLKIWLPEGVVLESLSFSRCQPPAIPESAQNYVPKIVPPAVHPRILVRPEILPKIRERLTQGENLPVWESVQAAAKAPIQVRWPEGEAVGHDLKLLRALQSRAFVYLMTGDETCGREAVEWTVRYLRCVEYGNLLDITREIGVTICTASWVYDWCFPLMNAEEKAAIEQELLRLADQMECGWPPFGQTIVNGHGAEAQIMRDLLTMGIALYDSDPEPYRLCSWRVLEELVPMRAWEYDSPRHNQGINYGNYRIQFEYFSDFLFWRMTGQRVFGGNLAKMPLYFLNMRVPNGQAFPDGDCYNRGILGYAPAAQIMYAWCHELAQETETVQKGVSAGPEGPSLCRIARLMKAQYLRERGNRIGRDDPVFFLLVNDPALEADFSFDALPLGFDSGTKLGSQIVRTGWMKETWLRDGKTAEADSQETVVELKGAGYTTRNHQHQDAGAFQIYFRGWLAMDLGLYHFYGLPYDWNFNKRSTAHNVCLIRDDTKTTDPSGKFVNDGGQLMPSRCPTTPEEAASAEFQTGKVLASVFEPSARDPKRGLYSIDLTASYADRAESYIRTFRWIRTGRTDVPFILAILDRMKVKDPAFRRFWQMNSLLKPENGADRETENLATRETLLVFSLLPDGAQCPPGRLALTTLLPEVSERKWDFIGDERANSIFGTPFTVPLDEPSARGWRTVLEDRNSDGSRETVFLNVLQILGDKADGTPAEPLPVQWAQKEGKIGISVGDDMIEFTE